MHVLQYRPSLVWRFVPDALPGTTTLHKLFNLLVHVGPQPMGAHKRLHFYNTRMALVQFVQDCRVVFSNNHPIGDVKLPL